MRVMEEYFNYLKRVMILLEENNQLLKELTNNSSVQQKKTKTYDLVHKKNASKYLLCTKEKLNKSIEEGVLVEKEHYITNEKRKWRFSKIALESLRGKL